MEYSKYEKVDSADEYEGGNPETNCSKNLDIVFIFAKD